MSANRTRITYIERKAGELEGDARIGRVTYSKSGRSIQYAEMEFVPIQGFKANYLETASSEEYWLKIRSQPDRRSPGMFQKPLSKSRSAHCVPATSPRRTTGLGLLICNDKHYKGQWPLPDRSRQGKRITLTLDMDRDCSCLLNRCL
jgi:hypothetical protein